MLKLLKNCSVYAPKYAGKKDILIMGERIHAVADDLSAWQAAPERSARWTPPNAP